MASTFFQRLDDLDRTVGHGKIEMRVKVDQVYAKYQHERTDLKHPAGGKAHYLRDPLMQGHRDWLDDVADQVLDRGPAPALVDASEALARGVYREAPLEFGDLKASPHPTVKDGGRLVYDRPPARRRLTESELRVKSHLRSLGFGNDGW